MTEPIKLYLDEDTISRALIRGLRIRGVDILTAQEAGQMEISDEEQLAFATSKGRVIFTFNTRDYVILHTEHTLNHQSHAGIIVSDQIHVGLIIRRLLKLLDIKSPEEMRNRLEYLSNWR